MTDPDPLQVSAEKENTPYKHSKSLRKIYDHKRRKWGRYDLLCFILLFGFWDVFG